jgi:hypothetical protein
MTKGIDVKCFTYTMEQLANTMKDMGVASTDFSLLAYEEYLLKHGYKLAREECIFNVGS